jgi:hypothetical protein
VLAPLNRNGIKGAAFAGGFSAEDEELFFILPAA